MADDAYLNDRVRAAVAARWVKNDQATTAADYLRWARAEQEDTIDYRVWMPPDGTGLFILRWRGVTAAGISGGYETFFGPVVDAEAAVRTIVALMKRDAMLRAAVAALRAIDVLPKE